MKEIYQWLLLLGLPFVIVAASFPFYKKDISKIVEKARIYGMEKGIEDRINNEMRFRRYMKKQLQWLTDIVQKETDEWVRIEFRPNIEVKYNRGEDKFFFYEKNEKIQGKVSLADINEDGKKEIFIKKYKDGAIVLMR